MAKSRKLDRLLVTPMPDATGGKKMVGEIGGMLASVRKVMEEAKLGIEGAVSELMTEVKDLKHIEVAIRDETKSVREMKTSILGNAVGGENQEDPPQ